VQAPFQEVALPPGTFLVPAAPAAGLRTSFLPLLLVLLSFAAPSARAQTITADPTALYFCVKLADITVATGNGAPMVQVAIDLDRVPGSGQADLGLSTDTKAGFGGRWERLLATGFGSGSAPRVYDPGFEYMPGEAVASSVTHAIEIKVPWASLGFPGPPALGVRFSVAVFRSGAADQSWEIGDATVSDALDAVTNDMDPRTSSYPNTWLDLQDGVLDYSCDVWFEPNGEPCAGDAAARWLQARRRRDAGRHRAHGRVPARRHGAAGRRLAPGCYRVLVEVGDARLARMVVVLR
jgi:hypothetical protein